MLILQLLQHLLLVAQHRIQAELEPLHPCPLFSYRSFRMASRSSS